MGRHVLIIEDEMLIAFALEDELRSLGFTSFDVAQSTAEALACAQRHRPDLVTADYRIIGGTGVEALRALDDTMGVLPAVFVTANPDMITGGRAPIIEKPLRPRSLAHACTQVGAIGPTRNSALAAFNPPFQRQGSRQMAKTFKPAKPHAAYTQRIILFLDFLGFRELVDRTVEEPAFLRDVVAAMDVVGALARDSKGLLASQQVTQFSDSIVVSYEVTEPSAVFWLLADIALCVVNLAERGFLVRGGVTTGQLYHTGRHVVGPAMVEAYRLESQVANVPRVVIDETVLDVARTARGDQHAPREEAGYARAYMTQDADGHYYFDYISWSSVIEVTGGENDGYGVYLETIGAMVRRGFENPDRRVREKYLWLHARYIAAIDVVAAMPAGHGYRRENAELCEEIEALPRYDQAAAAIREAIGD